jgi:hypothetical protein
LWAHFSEIKEENLRRSGDSIFRWNSEVDKCLKIAEANLLPNGKHIVLDNFQKIGNSEVEISSDLECPFLGKEAWINYEGRFDPCCAPDEQRLLHFGNFGKLTTDEDGKTDLMKIWNSAKYNDLKMNYKKNSLCKTCNMRRPPASLK